MAASAPPSPEQFFRDHPLGLAVFERVRDVLEPVGPVEVRVSTSQVAFRRRTGFAYVWLPAMYLTRPDADVTLSLALRHRIPSRRWKQVVEPYPGRWMHHLEVRSLHELDDDVVGWLREAAQDAV